MRPDENSDVAGAAIAVAGAPCHAAAPAAGSRPLPEPACPLWPADLTSGQDCQARIESRTLGAGMISRLRCAPAAAVSFQSATEEPAEPCIHALYVLSGEIALEQAGCESTARSRGVIAFDAVRAATVTLRAGLQHDIMALTIPRRRFAENGADGAPLGGILVTGNASASPLSSSLRLIAEHMLDASKDELTILFEACTSLLALAARRCTDEAMHGDAAQGNSLLRAILDYADRNAADVALRPAHVARQFGISTRYLHKLFRTSGTTFCSYVLNRRLEQIRAELAAPSAGPQPIATLALKWGFKDLSTFNKAFRRRFGCAPRDMRARARC